MTVGGRRREPLKSLALPFGADGAEGVGCCNSASRGRTLPLAPNPCFHTVPIMQALLQSAHNLASFLRRAGSDANKTAPRAELKKGGDGSKRSWETGNEFVKRGKLATNF